MTRAARSAYNAYMDSFVHDNGSDLFFVRLSETGAKPRSDGSVPGRGYAAVDFLTCQITVVMYERPQKVHKRAKRRLRHEARELLRWLRDGLPPKDLALHALTR